MLFVNEYEAPELLGWERQHVPLLTVAHADRAAEAILLRYPFLTLVIVSCTVAHVCRERRSLRRSLRRPSHQAVPVDGSVRGAQVPASLSALAVGPPPLGKASSFESWQLAMRAKGGDSGATAAPHPTLDLMAQLRVACDVGGRDDPVRRSSVAAAIGRERAAAEAAVTLVLPRARPAAEDLAEADAFVGGFLAALARKLPTAHALLWAHAASSLLTLQASMRSLDGAATCAHASMPSSVQLQGYIDRLIEGSKAGRDEAGADAGKLAMQSLRDSDGDGRHARQSLKADAESASDARRYFEGKASSLPEDLLATLAQHPEWAPRRSLEQYARVQAELHSSLYTPSSSADGDAPLLEPPSYLGQNAWHCVALSASLPALSLLLQSCSGGAPNGEVLASTLQSLRQRDAFGLTPVQRAYECHQLEPTSPRLLNMLTLLLAARMLLAAAFGKQDDWLQISDGTLAHGAADATTAWGGDAAGGTALRRVAMLGELAIDVGKGDDEQGADSMRTEEEVEEAGELIVRSSFAGSTDDDEDSDDDEEEDSDGEAAAAASYLLPSSRPSAHRRIAAAALPARSGPPADCPTEPEILADGSWLFARSLPGDALDAAATVAVELLHAGSLAADELTATATAVGGASTVAGVAHAPEWTAAQAAGGALILEGGLRSAQQSRRAVAMDLVVHCCLPALLALEKPSRASGGAGSSGGESDEATMADGQTDASSSFGEALLRARASDGATLLVAAAGAGASPLVERLLLGERRGGVPQVDVSAATRAGMNALHYAAAGSHREVSALLLARTGLPLVGPGAADGQGRTPLDLCPARFREELKDLFEQTSAQERDAAALPRRVLPSDSRLVAGRYAVHTSVGKRVVLAQDVRNHRPCALKFFPSAESLEREASLCGIVGPENAPEIYDAISLDEVAAESSDRQHILVMQSADPNYSSSSLCSSLSHFCRGRARHGLEAATHALHLVQRVLSLHERGLVHGDLKAEHFLRFAGEWKLIDLGTVAEEGSEGVPTGYTLRYAAPEQASAILAQTPLRVSAAIDCWALGVILYQLFTGRPLLTEADELSLRAIATRHAELYSGRVSTDQELSEPQRRLLLNLLDPNPERRGRSSGAGPVGEGVGGSDSRPATLADAPADGDGGATIGNAGGETSTGTGGASSSSCVPALRELLGRSFFAATEDTEEAKHVEVLALFCSPRRFRNGARIAPLQLMREVAALQENIPRRMRELKPAARFPQDIAAATRQASPRVITFSGHGLQTPDGTRRLAFEMEDGTIALPPPAMLVQLLRHMPRLECVFLNACHTLHPGDDPEGKSLGERIIEALPHLTVIGWRSLTEDRAAAAFCRGFYDALARGLVGGGAGQKVTISEAYSSGEEAFTRMGFVRGDPQGPLGTSVHGEYGKLTATIRSKQRKDSKVSLDSASSKPPSRQTYSRRPSASVEVSPAR